MSVVRHRWVAPVTFALTIAGAGVSGYLTIVHYTSSKLLACVSTGVINCERVTTSAQSEVIGVPVALLGLGWFLAMCVLCSPWAWRSALPWLRALRLLGVVAGMVFVLWLVYAELFVIRAICLWCTVVHVLAFALFVIVVMYGTETTEEG
jgi:uncharacterized membrane protein